MRVVYGVIKTYIDSKQYELLNIYVIDSRVKISLKGRFVGLENHNVFGNS